MPVFISMLRGINVGQKKVPMDGLKALYEKLGYKEITTYIQSGNVIFSVADKVTEQQLAGVIEKALLKKYKFEVPVIIRTPASIRQTLSGNPFLKEKGINIEKLHVTFLSAIPSAGHLDNIKKIDYPPDRFIINKKEIYLYCPNGYGITRLSNSFFENKLNVTATTRNWKTVNKLAELSAGK